MRNIQKLAGLAFAAALADRADAAGLPAAVRRVFQTHCVSCHNTSRASGGLDLSTFEGVLAGGDSGEALVAGDPEDSYLYLVTAHAEEPAMPPTGERIPEDDLAVLRRWIELGLPEHDGAVDPTDPSPAGAVESPVTARPEARRGDDGPPLLSTAAGPLVALAASPAGEVVAVGRPLAVVLYESATQSPVARLAFPEGDPQSLVFSADGRWLTAAGGEHGRSGTVVVWTLDGNPARAWEWRDDAAFDALRTADLSPDRTMVVVGGTGPLVRVVSTESGETLHSFDKPTDWVLDARFSPDGLLVGATDRDGGVYVWETHSGDLLHSFRGHRDAAVAIRWSSGGDTCVSASHDGDVRVWDLHTGGLVSRWAAHAGGIAKLEVLPDRAIVTAGRTDGRVSWWAATGAALAAPEGKLASSPTAAAPLSAGAAWLGTLDGSLLAAQVGKEPTMLNTLAERGARLIGHDSPPDSTMVSLRLPAPTALRGGATTAAPASPNDAPMISQSVVPAADARDFRQLSEQRRRAILLTDAATHAQLANQALVAAADGEEPDRRVAEAAVLLRIAVERIGAAAEDKPEVQIER